MSKVVVLKCLHDLKMNISPFIFLFSLIEEGGDWDRRNRLKVYQGLYCVAIRDFKQAAELFLDTVSTFTSYELMDYKTFVTYTVYVCMIALKRPDLREKVRERWSFYIYKSPTRITMCNTPF